MKLAESLIIRSDLQKKMQQIKQRMLNNIIVQEGDTPSEDPINLLEEYMSIQDQLTKLIQSINQTNQSTLFNEEMSLSDALVKRDFLLSKRAILIEAAEKASEKQDRYSRSEIKYISMMDAKNLQLKADQLSKEYRKLDTQIQAINWNTDLL